MTTIDKNAIAQHLRDITGDNIATYARKNHVSRKSIYDAIKGEGSLRIRVAIARAVKIPPSMLWSGNDSVTKIVDDIHYMGLAS